jgi:hypothetical protein
MIVNDETRLVEEAARILAENRVMESPENVARFRAAVGSLAGRKDPVALRALFNGFDDSSRQQDVIESLIPAVESFPPNDYVTALLDELPELHSRAQSFALLLHVRLSRDPNCVTAYGEALASASAASRQAAATTLEEVVVDKYSEQRDIATAKELLRILYERV